MDTFKRLIFVCFLACLQSVCYSYGGAKKENVPTTGCADGSTAAGAAACYARDSAAHIAAVQPGPGSSTVLVFRSSGSCDATGFCSGLRYDSCYANNPSQCPFGSVTFSFSYNTFEQYKCTNGSNELQNGKCECQLGFKPDSQMKCVPYSCPGKGSYSAVTQPDRNIDAPGVQCMDGCNVNPASVKAAPDGQLYMSWPYKYTGDKCGGKKADDGINTGQTTREAPKTCPAAQCPGTFNGASVCVPCSSTTVPGASTSASGVPGTAPDGTPLPDGATSTTNTTCNQSSCTTTTTVTDKNGNPIGQSQQEKPKENFCQENPQLQICKDGRWGGSCGAYTCDGDAVQCALSLQVHKSACEWSQLDPELKAKGEAGLAGGDRPEGHPGNAADSKSISFSSAISTADVVGGGSCPSDTSISYAGKSLVIPWSRTCDSLQMVGNLAMAVCMLAAAFIVFR